MANDHHIISLLVQLSPRLVSNGHLSQGLSAFEGEGWEDEDFLLNLNTWCHLFFPGAGVKRDVGEGRLQWWRGAGGVGSPISETEERYKIGETCRVSDIESLSN